MFYDTWTIACQPPLFMGFPRQEYWNGLPVTPPGDLSDPEMRTASFALQVELSLTIGLPLWLRWQRIHLQCWRPGFDPWVGKIPWRTESLPTPVFLPGEFHGLYRPWGRKESHMTEQLSLSFKTILLDCIVTAVISACIKKLIKIGEFLCSYFNIEDARKKSHFQHIMFYFKEGENATETQKKICAVYGEDALTDRTY